MPLNHAAPDRRREYDQRYRALHPTTWRLEDQLRNARYRHRRKPSDRLAATIARLTAEIDRLRMAGNAPGLPQDAFPGMG